MAVRTQYITQVSVSSDLLLSLARPDDFLKEMIEDKLVQGVLKEIKKDVMSNMEIEKQQNINCGTITYTGTYDMSNPGVITSVSTANTKYTPITPNSLTLRVVEYTKNNKVSRVELQLYDFNRDDWIKIPRVQIEE